MRNHARNPFSAKALCATGSLLALATSMPAFAQETADVGEVVVTASRIQSAGFTAPTPTTVLGTAELTRRAATSVQEALMELPSIRPGTTPQQTSSPTNGANSGAGGSQADMHGLGNARTLTLVNGHRTGASTDLRQFPTSLIGRVETISGGASAAYGSDAVAGVVNIILDTKFVGLKGQAQYGQTKYGDDKSPSGAIAWGGELFGGRMHLLIGGEYSQTTGAHTTQNIYDDKRPWFAANRGLNIANPCPYNAPISNNCPTGGNGLPQFIDTDDQNFSTMNPGGIIVSGPLKGITFEDGGIPRQFRYGLVLGNNQIGGEGANPSIWWSRPWERRHNLLARVDFKLTDTVNLWLEYGNSQTHNKVNFVRARDQGNLTIRRDNAFLPAPILAEMTRLSLNTLTMGRFNNDGGQGFSHNTSQIYRWAGGLDGQLGGSWGWDAYAQYGLAHSYTMTDSSRNTAKWNFALDSVLVNGVPTCRAVTQNNPMAAGCVPFNIFGPNAASQAARNYIFGVQSGNSDQEQYNAQFNLHGEPIKTWAGPVAVAMGVEYRKETSNSTSDPIAQVGGWDSGNSRGLKGQFNVKEGYAEIAVPLAKETPFLYALDVNGAVRYADYSSVKKGVTTYKIGATWRPIEELLIRTTYSKDVRAPSINQLFSPGGTSRNNIVQPFGPTQGQSTLVDFVTAGNPNLRPETGKTWIIGATLQPRFTRFRFSADYYNIKLTDQIGTAGVQVIVDLCRQGRQDLCSLITFDPNRTVTAVLNANVNNNGFEVRGIDFEASYTLPLTELPFGLELPGTLSARALATRTLEFASVTIGGREDKVGQNANGVLAGEPPNMPKWLANYALQYSVGPATLGVSFRYISPGVLESQSITGTNTTRLNNKLGSQTTTNFQASYVLLDRDGRRLQLYGVINNAFNRGPPFPIYPVTQWPAFYDTLGMVMRAGIRFQY
jgi:outer membrane receptor protein involved in Fe transport